MMEESASRNLRNDKVRRRWARARARARGEKRRTALLPAAVPKSTLAYVRNLHDALTYEELTERLLRVSIQNRTSKNLTVDAKSFRGVFAELARAAGSGDGKDLDGVHHAIFGVLSEGRPLAEFSRLLTGLSVLCRDGGLKGSGQNEIDSFNMIDRNGDGVITLSKMTEYMEAALKVIFAVVPHKQQECGTSAVGLADATARQAFNDADVNHDGMITVEEFLLWCEKPVVEKEDVQLSLLVPGLHASGEISSHASDYLKDIRARFDLRNVTVAEALGCFEDVNVDEGITKEKFFVCSTF